MNKEINLSPELLAPAGDWDALRAAVANGADAVYFGLPAFNARHRATNFELAELPRILEYLHSRHVKGFVTLNVLIFSNELKAAFEYVKSLAIAGIDAVIVQDLGLARLIREAVPGLHVHASTQMTLSEPRGIKRAHEWLNLQRIVLPRELSVADISKVAGQSAVPTEVFIHGALCVAYSGQCLTSEALGGRSANRGQCAQACRLPYEMLVDGVQKDLGELAYLLSPQDLAGHDQVDALVKEGVVSFKIEGRLKSAHYVAAATQAYRTALDAAIVEAPYKISTDQKRHLQQTFSRGFTPGFLDGVDHQRLVQGRFPKSRGLKLGQVVEIRNRSIVVDVDHPEWVKPGDGVCFDLGNPSIKEPGGRIWQVKCLDAHRVELAFEMDAIDFAEIPKGCLVWKTDDPILRKQLEHSFAQEQGHHLKPIRFTLSGKIGESLELRAEATPYSSEAEWVGPIDRATKHPWKEERIVEALGRLGGTPYQLGNIEFNIPADAMIPVSILNDLRRQVVEQLKNQLLAPRTIPIENLNALSTLRSGIQPIPTETTRHLNVVVRRLDQLQAVLEWKSDRSKVSMVYCDFESPKGYREAVELAKNHGMPIGLATLRILKPGEEGFLKAIAQAEPDAVLVRNLGAFDYFQETAPKLRLIGDFSLNVANELTADLLIKAGFERVIPSFDLNWEQLADLLRHSPPAWYEAVIHQYMPMFHMEHCVFAAFMSTGKDWRDCGRPCETHRVELRDRVGAEFPVIPDAGCRNTVYNGTAQTAAEYVARMIELGIRQFRLDLLRETPIEIPKLLEDYSDLVAGRLEGRELWRTMKITNQLGVTRGTLNLV
jgi:U32 family peptidase